MSQEIKTVSCRHAGGFTKKVNELLKEGWKIVSAFNSQHITEYKMLSNTCTNYWNAVLVREITGNIHKKEKESL